MSIRELPLHRTRQAFFYLTAEHYYGFTNEDDMAPKKSKKVVSVTKKKKVVEETIKVTVTDGVPNVTTETDTQETQELETQDLPLSIPVEEENVTRVEIPVDVGDDRSPPPSETVTPASEGTVKETHKVEIPVDVRDDRSPQPPETPAPASEVPSKETHKVEEKEGNKKKKMLKKRNKNRSEVAGDEYKRYVYKVMKQVHPDLGISSKAMTVINMFMGDMFERLAVEAAKLNDYSKRRTLSSREIEAAVRLVLPGELSRHAVAEGSKAISNFVAYGAKKRYLAPGAGGIFTSCSDCFLHLKEEQKPVQTAQESACAGFTFKPLLTKVYANPPPEAETMLQSLSKPNQKQRL
ncbi:unnamed protein product [Brassica oleracea]|uniref:(rape) hypothetical protein n=1 Tax=Brassica napus TaxID=3708 RepID=A0A816KNR1_BRANA|nr:unnamed protein product [Brassica napus]